MALSLTKTMPMPADLDASFREYIPPFGASGNPVDAARKAVFNFAAKRRAAQGRSRPGDPGYAAPKAAAPASGGWGRAVVVSAPPLAGARQSPNDGKWYVQTGTKGGKPTYVFERP